MTSNLSSLLLSRRAHRAVLGRLAAGGLGAALLVACGGAGKGETEGPKKPAEPETEDVTIEVEKPAELQGSQWNPDALGRPSLKFVEVKNKKLTLDKQRAVFAKAKPAQKEAEAQVLVTLVFQAIRGEKDPAKAKALVEEARTALREARGAAGDKAQFLTLFDLASLEIGAGDYAAAAEIYKDALARFPEGEPATLSKTWLAYTQVRLGQNTEVQATTQGLVPAPEAPELSYVLAWVRWRAGDLPGAVEAITAAARGWKSASSKPLLDRDASIMMARAGTPVEDAVTLIVDSNQNQRDQTYVALFKLHSAFVSAGRFADAVVILDRAAARVGEKIPVQDLAKFYIQQADYTLRSGIQPAQVVVYQKKALETYAACADKCTKEEHEEGATTTRNLATFYDTVFRTARDERFYQPAADLYALYLALPGRPDVPDVTRFSEEMKAAKQTPDAAAGKHDPAFMLTFLGLHNLEVQACYENVLVTEPTVAGSLTATLEVTATGEVKGVSTDPAAGAAGMAKVAGCVTERAKSWAFPTRTKPGTTRLIGKYTLAPAAARQ